MLGFVVSNTCLSVSMSGCGLKDRSENVQQKEKRRVMNESDGKHNENRKNKNKERDCKCEEGLWERTRWEREDRE